MLLPIFLLAVFATVGVMSDEIGSVYIAGDLDANLTHLLSARIKDGQCTGEILKDQLDCEQPYVPMRKYSPSALSVKVIAAERAPRVYLKNMDAVYIYRNKNREGKCPGEAHIDLQRNCRFQEPPSNKLKSVLKLNEISNNVNRNEIQAL